MTSAKGNDLENRLVDFAVRIIRLSAALPQTPAGKHIQGQILRSGTSPAPNYGEARSAESTRDFIHKMRIALKELNETRIWLKIIVQAELLSQSKIGNLLDECEQLCRIINAGIQTAKRRAS